jgi:CBS domain-containing protein
MKVKEIMTTGFETIESTQSLEDAAKKMARLAVGILPVEEGNEIVGIVTDRDIVVRGLAEEKDPTLTSVSEVMSSNLIWCYQDDDVEKAGKLMEERKVRRLLVCDQNDVPVGILSLGDLAVKTHQEQFSGEVLEFISEPSRPNR